MKKTKLALGVLAALLLVAFYAVRLYHELTPPPPAPTTQPAPQPKSKKSISYGIGITFNREVKDETQ
jgi:hypothetical protein